MTKKEYVIEALKLFKWKRDQAESLISTIEKWEVSDTFLDIIIKTIDVTISQLKDGKEKEKLSIIRDTLVKIKEAETIAKEEDNNSLQELEKSLNILVLLLHILF